MAMEAPILAREPGRWSKKKAADADVRIARSA